MVYKRYLFNITILAILFFGVITGLSEKQGVLDPENANEARLNRLQPPDKVMDAIGVRPGMVVAEIGAGRGRYVVHLSVRVGEKGKVYAEDINTISIIHLEKRCKRWGLKNVQTILGEVKDPKLPVGELDLIFIISAYHHFNDPVILLRNARPALKPGGILAIGEWHNPNRNTITPKQMEAQMNDAGYRLKRIETFLQKNNMLIYIFQKEGNK